MNKKGKAYSVAYACYELGLIYQNGKYRPKNLARAEQIYADNCNQDKPRSTSKTCVAMAEIYSEKNKFLKADSLYKKLCKNNGGGTNCDLVILDRQEHFCKLGKTQSCDDSYVFSLIEAARKN